MFINFEIYSSFYLISMEHENIWIVHLFEISNILK